MLQPKKILVIGGGFGGVYTLKGLQKFFRKDPAIEITLVSDKNYFLFTPLLHEVATGGINPENIIEPIVKVFGKYLASFYLGKVELINLKERIVKIKDDLISYDYLVIAPGSQTNFYNISGAEKYSFTLKSLEDAIKIKNNCIVQIERASHIMDRELRRKMLRFVVVGGGPTGVELAAEIQELIKETFSRYYSKEIIEDAFVVLIEKGPELLASFGVKMRKKALEVLRKKGIKVMLDTKVKEVGISEVFLDNNKSILTETVIWVAGIKPIDIKFDTPVEKSSAGQLMVNEYLELIGQKQVFAIGDSAVFGDKKLGSLPALAQVAEKQAARVAKNIQLLINGDTPKAFSYRHSGNLISVGRWMALGEISDFTFWGRITWWVWRTVYLCKLISFRKKVEVAIDWTINIFSPRDISQF